MSNLVSQAEFARSIGKSRQYINKLVKTEKIPVMAGGMIDPVLARAALSDQSDPARSMIADQGSFEDEDDAFEGEDEDDDYSESGPARGNAQGPSYAKFRTAREGFQAKLAEVDFLERTGRLVKKDEVDREAFDAARQVRDRVLSVPHDVAGVLVGMQDEREIVRFLQNKLRDALMEAAKDVRFGERD